MQHCTFQPKVNVNAQVNTQMHRNQVKQSKGVDNYIRRQQMAKQETERKNQVFSQSCNYHSVMSSPESQVENDSARGIQPH